MILSLGEEIRDLPRAEIARPLLMPDQRMLLQVNIQCPQEGGILQLRSVHFDKQARAFQIDLIVGGAVR